MVALPGEALLQLITASTILPMLICAATVALYLTVRNRLDRREGAFDLGLFELPVAIVALLWLVVAVIVLVTPAAALVAVLIVIGLLLVGGLYFVYLLIFNRGVLDTSPETPISSQ